MAALSRIFHLPKSPPDQPPEFFHDHRLQRPADRPPPTGPCAGPARRRPGCGRRPEAVLSDHTQRVYGTQWGLSTGWCSEVGLRSLPAEALTVARYLAVRAGEGSSIATMRLATSAIAKAHEWAGHESPGRDQGVRASLRDGGGDFRSPSARPAPSPPTCSPSSASPPSSPVAAAAASKRKSRLRNEAGSTWLWWPCCPTPD